MNNLFINYEQALELKELGFDEPCFAHYCNGDLIAKSESCITHILNNTSWKEISTK